MSAAPPAAHGEVPGGLGPQLAERLVPVRADAEAVHQRDRLIRVEAAACEHDPGADNADANFDRAVDGEKKDDAARAPDRPKRVDRDDRRGVASERCGVGCEIG